MFGTSTQHVKSYATSLLPKAAPTPVAAVAGAGALMGFIGTCNYYATIIGYLTIAVVVYLIISWFASLFSSNKSSDNYDHDDYNDYDCDDLDEPDEPPKRKKKRRKK